MFIASDQVRTIVRNNLCYQNATDDIRNDAGTSTIDSNHCQGTGCQQYGNPQLTATYHPQPGSPVINAGTQAGGLCSVTATDPEGVQRCAGKNPSIGAFEGTGVAPLPSPSNLRILSQ